MCSPVLHETLHVTSPAFAKDAMNETVDLVFTNVRLSEDAANRDGIQLLSCVKEHHPDTPVLVMSAYRDHDAAVEAANFGAAHYLKEPIQLRVPKELIESLSVSNE